MAKKKTDDDNIDVTDAWSEFCRILKLFPKTFEDMNTGCKKKDITKAEKEMGMKFPLELSIIYLENNGQKGTQTGIFKALSGWNKYTRPMFLPLESVVRVWKKLKDDPDIDVFKTHYIPFAVYKDEELVDDVYCLDGETGEVYLLWVLLYDPFSPPDWQTARYKRAKRLADFLVDQRLTYW
jgi:hypothetical protein